MYNIFLGSSGVATDSRAVAPGSLFFALHGDRFDGNRFAADALAAGAAFAVVDDPRVAIDERYLVVGDTLLTLQHLAAHHRRALGVPVLAITGTNGKTTTKELVSRVLAAKFDVTVTRGNLNNHIGVPLTLLSMTRSTQLGVVEMGASALGEIKTLCEIAAPDFGIITNVGRAHLEGFGCFEGVKRAKGELYEYLAAHGGTAFVLSDDADLTAMASGHPGLKIVWYSAAAADGIRNPMPGDYNLMNIAAAVTAGKYFGIDRPQIKRAVESYEPDNNRSQLVDTGRNVVILDCYNANPSSMRAAIGDFAHSPSGQPRAVILGDMMELGSYAREEHGAILALLEEVGVNDIYLVGPNFTQAVRDCPTMPAEVHIRTFTDVADLRAYFSANPLSGRRILVKGSHSMRLENIKDLL